MPQMAPYSWISLFLFFNCIFLLLNISIYFFIYYSHTNYSTSLIKSIKFNMKW